MSRGVIHFEFRVQPLGCKFGGKLSCALYSELSNPIALGCVIGPWPTETAANCGLSNAAGSGFLFLEIRM